MQEGPVQLAVAEGAEESSVPAGEGPHAEGGRASDGPRLEPAQ